MSKLSRSSGFAQLVIQNNSNHKLKDIKKNVMKELISGSKLHTQKKINTGISLNVLKKLKEHRDKENSSKYTTPTKCSAKVKEECNKHYNLELSNKLKSTSPKMPSTPQSCKSSNPNKTPASNRKLSINSFKCNNSLFKSPKSSKPNPIPEIVDIESDDESVSPSPIQNKGITILSFKNALLTEYDLNLIKDGWLNDADIDFFAFYSLYNISDNKRLDKYYIFPSFLSLYLFKSIEKIDKSWFKDLNLKKVKYLIFPINLDMHWSLAVMVNANKYYKKYKDHLYEYKESTQPFIILMDSMGIHSITVIQDKIRKLYCKLYSEEEEEEEHKKIFHQPLELPYKKLDLPRQENARDCGVFVLFYLFYFLQSQEIIDFSSLKEWSKKCNFPKDSKFLRSYLMYLVHEIYLDKNKNKEKKDRNFNKNKKIINSLHDRNYLIEQNELLLKLNKTCPLLPMKGLIKQTLISVKEKDKEKNESNNQKEDKEEEDSKLPSVMDILEGKTLKPPQQETETKCVKRKLDNNYYNSENNEGAVKKICKMVGKIKNMFKSTENNKPKNSKTNNINSKPIIPKNATNNIKEIIPKRLEQLSDSEDIPPVKSLHEEEEEEEENKKVIKKKKIKNNTHADVVESEKEIPKKKKRKKEDEETPREKKHKALQSKINFSEKTKNELDKVKTPTKKK